MRSAVAVHWNGFGFALCSARYDSIACSRALTVLNTPRRIRLYVISAKDRSIWLIQELLVGVEWTTNRGCRASHRFTAGVLWVA